MRLKSEREVVFFQKFWSSDDNRGLILYQTAAEGIEEDVYIQNQVVERSLQVLVKRYERDGIY